MYRGKQLVVGSQRLLQDKGIEVSQNTQTQTTVFVGYDGQYCGAILFEDTLRDHAQQVLSQCRHQGIQHLALLTGDKAQNTFVLQEKLHLDEVLGDCFPEDKANYLKMWQEKGHAVAFVGDGVNDALALVEATVGMALGKSGSEAAIDYADIVITDDDLRNIPKVLRHGRKTRRVLLQNISMIVLVKVIFLGLSFLGFANMWMAVFADVGVTLLAIINALRCYTLR